MSSSGLGFFFSPLERRIRKFLCEDFFILSNIRFCASCPDAACREESLITEAGGANARPSARVSRRVRKLHCERDAGLQRGRRERRRVRYHPESDDYFFFTPRVFKQFKAPPDCALPRTRGKRSAGLAAVVVVAVDASPPRCDENGPDCGVSDVKRPLPRGLAVAFGVLAPHKGTQRFLLSAHAHRATPTLWN